MREATALHKFMHLFNGNHTVFGSEEGGVIRGKHWSEAINDHLSDHEPCGIYPMIYDEATNEWLVKWGCVDFDIQSPTKRRWDYANAEDAWTASSNLINVLAALNLVGWREVTKSGGIHVWVFAHDWTLAATMRRALLVACSVADVPPTEVNPKSEGFTDPNSIGNYVRLPYRGWHQNRIQRPMVDAANEPIGWEEFVTLAWEQRATTATLAATAALWHPPTPPRVASQPQPYDPDRHNVAMSRRLAAVVENGPLRKGEDRSGWLFYVARLCADDGLSMSEACEIVALCDEVHTHKFTSRNDGWTRITRTVEKAYS